MTTYKVLFFDTSCHFWYSIDNGVTYTEGTTPIETMHDEWSDLEMAFNDGDFNDFVIVDQTVTPPLGSSTGGQGGIQIGSLSTLASTPSGALINYGTNPFGFHANGDTTGLNAAYSSTAGTILMAVNRVIGGGAIAPRISSNNGATWSDVSLSSTGGWIGAAFNQSATVMYIHEYTGHVQKSTDGGATWSQLLNSPVYSIFTGGLNQINTYRIRCSESGNTVATISGNFGLFDISSDGGATWTETDLESLAPGIDPGSSARGDFGMTLNGSRFVATIGGSLASDGSNYPWFWTSSNGISWTQIFPPWGAANGRFALVINISQDGQCIAVGYDAISDGVFHADISLDAGMTWSTVTFGPQADILVTAHVIGGSSPPMPRTFNFIERMADRILKDGN